MLDREQCCRIRLHNIAHIDKSRTGATTNRRVYVAILQVELRILDGGLCCLWLCLAHGDGILLGVIVLL